MQQVSGLSDGVKYCPWSCLVDLIAIGQIDAKQVLSNWLLAKSRFRNFNDALEESLHLLAHTLIMTFALASASVTLLPNKALALYPFLSSPTLFPLLANTRPSRKDINIKKDTKNIRNFPKRTMTNPAVPPELASILATLAQFAPQQQPEQQSPQPPTITAPTTADPRLLRRQQAQSSHPPFPQTSSNQSNPYTPQAANFNPVQSQQRSTPQPTEQTIIDPATITEWSAGLRCVTKIAAQNPLFGDKIRGVSFRSSCTEALGLIRETMIVDQRSEKE